MEVEEPVPLPVSPVLKAAKNVHAQAPLSRRGKGPGLITIMPNDLKLDSTDPASDLDPLQKWGEEGFTVIQVTNMPLDHWTLADAAKMASEGLVAVHECNQKDKFGLICYDPSAAAEVSKIIATNPRIACVVSYDAHLKTKRKPLLFHGSGTTASPTASNLEVHNYPEAKGPHFVQPGHEDFRVDLAAVAHSRTLAFFNKHLGGPAIDVEKVWEEHTYYKFKNRSANTIGSMVQGPYLSHTPTMTGSLSDDRIVNFYRYHCIWNQPEGTSLERVSRTIDCEKVIDEIVFCCKHDEDIDWLLPGIPPTGKEIRIPITSVVQVRGDRVASEELRVKVSEVTDSV